MFSFLKYLPSLLLLKDVSAAYKEENGKDKPAWISKRFIGSILLVGASVVGISWGVSIPADTLDHLADHLSDFATVVTGLYGAVMVIVGIFQKRKGQADAGTTEQPPTQ